MNSETVACPTYILTDTTQVACHGSFTSLENAMAYGKQMQELGLCETYTVGGYTDGMFQSIFTFSPELGYSPAGIVPADYSDL
jgi:hypothetical protein